MKKPWHLAYRRPISLLLSLLFLSACGADRLEPLVESDVILAFGDSLTHGVGSSNGDTYPATLARLTGLTVINAGISGETTNEGAKRLQSVIAKYDPQLLILLEGGNDILQNHDKASIKRNLEQMIELALARGIQIILIGVPEKKLFSDSAEFYQELADKYDLVFADDLLADLLRSIKYKSDPIHLNSAGYQKLAEGIAQLLKENGALN